VSTGVVLTILSVWCYVFLNLVQRTAARESINPRAMAFWFNFWAILLSLGILLISGQGGDIVWPTDIRAYIFLGLGILAYGIYERMRYYVARDLEASVYAIIGNLAVLVAFLGSLVWYKEELSMNKVFGVGLIIAAIRSRKCKSEVETAFKRVNSYGFGRFWLVIRQNGGK
jgi:drug/metabolite transporter (DMT)-like permease